MFRSNGKHFLLLILSIIVIFNILSCGGDPRRIEERFNNFKETIGPDAYRLFEDGRDSVCAGVIDSLTGVDGNYKAGFERLKAEEAIDLFDTREVVEYYREYFADSISLENK
ncbi:MAG: hypothetical protein GF307_14235 [candidate division Zixibacteria bacterium]|nr:hypothetical protein [candidate division Zixibacteria bacterium]